MDLATVPARDFGGALIRTRLAPACRRHTTSCVTYVKGIIAEPTYTDAPHIGPSSDDHAPSAINGGQKFLLEAYQYRRPHSGLTHRPVLCIKEDLKH
jgi:hypothetical protein